MDQIQEKATRISCKALPVPEAKKRLALRRHLTESEFEKKGNESFVTKAGVNRNQEEYRNTDDNYDIELLSFLIDNFLLRINGPFPVLSDLPKKLQSGVYQNSASGSAYPEAKSSTNLLDQVSNYIQLIFRRKF